MDTGLDALKTSFKKVVHNASEFLRNEIADAVTKSNGNKIVKQENVEEIITLPEMKRWNIEQIKTSIIKMEQYKTFKLQKRFKYFETCGKK